MIDSILTTVKKVIGLTEEDTHFDEDLILHLNSEFNMLKTIGVREDDFMITDSNAVWSDYLQDLPALNVVKTYLCLRAKKLFDPPTSSILLQALNEEIDRYEWKINVIVEQMENV